MEEDKMGPRAQVESLALDKSRDSWSFIKEEREYMSRDESMLVDIVWETYISLVTASIYQWNKSLKWRARRCGRFLREKS